MDKTIFLGTLEGHNTFARIKIKNECLSITGHIGHMRNGNCVGSCGQIHMSFREYDSRGRQSVFDILPNGDLPMVYIRKFFDIWNRWHLNDMQAGSPVQMEYLRNNPVDAIYPESHYEKASKALEAAGLNPDNGYKYGSAWLKEDMSKEVIAFLTSLPNASINPVLI